MSYNAHSNHAPVDNIVVPSLGGSDESFFPGEDDYTDSNLNDETISVLTGDKTHAEVQSDEEYEEYDMPILEYPLAEYDYESQIELESDVAMATVCDTVANEKEESHNQNDLPEECVMVNTQLADHRSESLDDGEILLLKLMKLCKDAQVPGYFFNEMLSIIQQTTNASDNRDVLQVAIQKHPNSNRFLKHINQIFPTPRPLKTLVGLEGFCEESVTGYRGGTMTNAQLVHWDPKEVLMDILGLDRVFKVKENITLVSSDGDRFKQTGGDTSNNTELLHGSWARSYIQSKGEEWVDGLDLLCPVVIYIDETHVTGNGRVKVTPVLMACGLLNKNVRYLQENIKPLAYIPRHDTDSSALKDRSEQAKGRAVRNFHKLMAVITRSLVDMKRDLLKKKTVIRIGNVHRRMRLHCPVAFFVGDAKQQDILAGRYLNQKTRRISRWCDTSVEQAGIPGHNCNKWLVAETKSIMEELYRWMDMEGPELNLLQGTKKQKLATQRKKIRELEKKLESISAHRVVNGLWETIDDDNTLLPLPHDMMHIFTRICRTLFELTVACLSQTERAVLDKLVEKLMGDHRSSETPRFPRVTFSGGFCSISELTSSEWIGKMFCLMILSHLPIGQKAMKDCFERKGARERKERKDDEEIPPTNPVTAKEVIDLFEDLLLFHAYYSIGWPYDRNVKKPPISSIFHWDETKEKILRDYIKKLQMKITKRFPRKKGQGWFFQKFHELLHLVLCISMYGMPDNYNADWGERALKQYGKKPGKLVKKKMDDEMLEKLADKIVNMDVVDKAYSICVDQADVDSESEMEDYAAGTETLDETMPKITYTHEKVSKYMCAVGSGSLIHKEWHRHRQLKKVPILPELVTNYFVKEYGNDDDIRFIHGYTELKIHREGVTDDMIFRCHPSFRSGPPWYDWCLVNFGENTGSSYPGNMFRGSGVTDENKVPCKILAIFKVESKDGMGTAKILVQRCRGSNHKNDSCLTESWQKYSILKTRRIPAMDKNRNILPSGQGKLIKVRYPKLEVVEPAMIELPLFVVEEDPVVRVYGEVANYEHSDNILVVRDRIEHWSLNFDCKLTKTDYSTNNY